jgi:hypothetical protein
MILVPGGDVEWAVKEVKRLRNETWVAAVWPLLPEGKPIAALGRDERRLSADRIP